VARQSLRRSSSTRSRLSLKAPDHLAQVCLELQDYSEARYSAIDFFQTRSARDPAAQAARIAEQFITRNRALMMHLDAQMEGDYDGRDLWLLVSSGRSVGAIPLFSATTAPRFRPGYPTQISVARNRTDVSRDGLAHSARASSPAAPPPFRAKSACLGAVIHGSHSPQGATRLARPTL
jgi:hypothetical protein